MPYDCEFTESTFAFAAMNYVANAVRLTAVPRFPTAIAEGRRFGYDVRFRKMRGRSLFFQFKCCTERQKGGTYNSSYPVPYFQFALRSINHQHNKMRGLAIQTGRAYYVAPLFWRYSKLDYSFRVSGKLGQSVVCINPATSKKIKPTPPHRCFYTASPLRAEFRSEADVAEALQLDGLIKLLGPPESFEETIAKVEAVADDPELREPASVELDLSRDESRFGNNLYEDNSHRLAAEAEPDQIWLARVEQARNFLIRSDIDWLFLEERSCGILG